MDIELERECASLFFMDLAVLSGIAISFYMLRVLVRKIKRLIKRHDERVIRRFIRQQKLNWI